MAEPPKVKITQSDEHREIYVTGQISNLAYDGLRIAVLHDEADYADSMEDNRIHASRIAIDRRVECTLRMSPLTMKSWAIALGREVKRYEEMFGTIPPPEAIRKQFTKHDK